MRIEAATREDVDRLVDQWVALAREQRDHGTFILPEENRERIREEFLRRVVTGEVLVAREDAPPEGDDPEDPSPGADVVGFVQFGMAPGGFAEDEKRGVVSNIYVRPDRRGQGVGAELLATAEERLSDRGATVVSLEAMADNEAARRFYGDRGYAPHRVELAKELDGE